MFQKQYANVSTETKRWQSLQVPAEIYSMGSAIDVRAQAAVCRRHQREPAPLSDIISGACSPCWGQRDDRPQFHRRSRFARQPAGLYLIAQGVKPSDFNSYGARRGNHEVMVRGTFATPACAINWRRHRRRWTTYPPAGELMTIYEASTTYQRRRSAAGASRARNTDRVHRGLGREGHPGLGVRAVIAESFERIHRSQS